jgi:hypothetical protein
MIIITKLLYTRDIINDEERSNYERRNTKFYFTQAHILSCILDPVITTSSTVIRNVYCTFRNLTFMFL